MSSVTDQQAAFADLITSEHAAIYAYGVIAAHLEDPERALDYMAIHRKKRDELIKQAINSDVPVPPATVAYKLPIVVETAESARACAATIEEGLCAHWSQSIPFLPADMQQDGVVFVQSSASRAFTWSGISKAFYL
jgi:hypothetical protein